MTPWRLRSKRRRNLADPLWTLREIVVATGGPSPASPAIEVTGFSIDSRSIAPGEAFVAIRGLNRDGHEFAASALEAGAALAIV